MCVLARTPHRQLTLLLVAVFASWSLNVAAQQRTEAGDASEPAYSFAVKGAGRVSCARFLEERSKRSAAYRLFGGWRNGYLSAIKFLDKDTFDIAPWQRTDTLAAALASYCTKFPREPFYAAVIRMERSLRPARLQEPSKTLELEHDGKPLLIYVAMLKRAQTVLREAGHFKGESHGLFDSATQASLKAFQRAQSLKETGMPDQVTLYRLLHSTQP